MRHDEDRTGLRNRMLRKRFTYSFRYLAILFTTGRSVNFACHPRFKQPGPQNIDFTWCPPSPFTHVALA